MKFKNDKKLGITTAVLVLAVSAFAVDGKYLADFDLLWDRTPKAYEESAFLGNGELGSCIWSARDETLHFDIGDTRVYSNKSRAPIGKFILKTAGKTTKFSMRLELHKALVSGKITTDKGDINFKSLASVEHDVILTEFIASNGEKINIEHFALPGAPADMLYSIRKNKSLKLKNVNDFSDPDTYKAIMAMKQIQNLSPETRGDVDGIKYRFVPLLGGQGYVLTWKFAETAPGRYLLAWTTDYNLKSKELPKTAGVETVRNAFKTGFAEISKDHQIYWKNYFAKPYISIPDKRIEANYWVQMYKYGSATRPGALPIDLMGPWFRATPWPRIWANLNVQLSYLPMAVANQPGIASTLGDWIDRSNNIFINAVDEKYQYDSASCGRGTSPYGPTGFWGEYGNFLWTLYDYWHFLRVYPDDKRITDKFYPILKRANNFCIHALTEDENGLLHMPIDISPEWKVKAEDTTYNLELLHWGLETAIYIGTNYKLQDSDTDRYRNILKKLIPKHINKDGIMLGKNMPLTDAHRHFSHLIGLYPLRRINIDSTEEHKLYLNTVNRWLGFKLKKPLTRNSWSYKGYSRTGATAMYAMLDKPEKALDQLQQYFDLYPLPNTFYLETGPVIETPLASAAATQELLIQSWGINNYSENLVRLFPGVPSAWPQACFDNLRAEGGYTVSAFCEQGKTLAFCITADQTGSLQLRFKNGGELANIISTQDSLLKTSSANGWTAVTVNLKQNESLIYGNRNSFNTRISDVNTSRHNFHFGLNKLQD